LEGVSKGRRWFCRAAVVMALAALAAAVGVAAGQAQGEPVLLKQELEHLDSKMTRVIGGCPDRRGSSAAAFGVDG